jgi:hypothetical protein
MHPLQAPTPDSIPAVHPLAPARSICWNTIGLTPLTQSTQQTQGANYNKHKPSEPSLFQPRRAQHQPIVPHRNCLELTRTHENQGTNNPLLGGYVLREKSIHQTQISYAMNVNNGIKLDRWGGGQFDTVCEVQKEGQADMMFYQEQNLASYKTQQHYIIHAIST